jgi:hypothetical protein
MVGAFRPAENSGTSRLSRRPSGGTTVRSGSPRPPLAPDIVAFGAHWLAKMPLQQSAHHVVTSVQVPTVDPFKMQVHE